MQANKGVINKNKPESGKLPANPTAALLHLIRVSQKIVDLSEKETQALVQRDMLAFSIIQDEKEKIVTEYTKVSEDFRNRLEEFRGIDRALLNRLEAIQNQIGEKTQSNNVIVLKMRERAETNTNKTLLLAQEYGQQKAGQRVNAHNQKGV